MPLLINRAVAENDPWQFVSADAIEANADLPVGDIVVPFAYYLENKTQLLAREGKVAVVVNGDDDLQALIACLISLLFVMVVVSVLRVRLCAQALKERCGL
jgi:uncharacterized protein (DUF934 family)